MLDKLLSTFILWLIIVALKVVRVLSRDKAGKVLFRDNQIILFPKDQNVGYIIAGKSFKQRSH